MKSSIKIKRGQIENVFKGYGTIAALLADQVHQSPNRMIEVIDASDDLNITFDPAETRRNAFYRYNDVATGSIDDYTLISTPYGNHIGGSGLQLGETDTTAHRGDYGKHTYDSINETEQYDFADMINTNTNF